jgi:hypothetical protein
MIKWFSIILLLTFTQLGWAQTKTIDTLSIYCDCTVNGLTPTKLMTFYGGKNSTYTDTLRVCSSLHTNSIHINKNDQYYYLIVYGKDSIKRYEGDFYDRHKCGLYILYDWDGNKTSETVYKLNDLPEDPEPSLGYHEPVTSNDYVDGKLVQTEDYLLDKDGFYTVIITTYNKKGKVKRRRKERRF